MGLFNRTPHTTDPATGTTAHPRRGFFNREKHATGTTTHHGDDGVLNRKPTFGQWIKGTWADLLTMVIMGVLGLAIYMAPPAAHRLFPLTFRDGEVVYPEFAYPLRKEIIPIVASAAMSAFIPILVFLIMQIRVRSFWDVNNAIIGLLYSLITAAVFQVFLKCLIGGLRPHFLAVCAPDLSKIETPGRGQGFTTIMFDRSICTGDEKEINDSLESFPSGHTTAGFAGFVFLYLYLNAKLKVWSNYHPAFWKLIATYAPILGATLIGGALTIDEYHNWYDVAFGAVIGTTMAISSYRMVYASVWDFRFNHIPLTRNIPFSYGMAGPGAGGFHSAVFTRKAGWGMEDSIAGAPFDASHNGGTGLGAGHHHNGVGHTTTGHHQNGLGHTTGHSHSASHDLEANRTAV